MSKPTVVVVCDRSDSLDSSSALVNDRIGSSFLLLNVSSAKIAVGLPGDNSPACIVMYLPQFEARDRELLSTLADIRESLHVPVILICSPPRTGYFNPYPDWRGILLLYVNTVTPDLLHITIGNSTRPNGLEQVVRQLIDEANHKDDAWRASREELNGRNRILSSISDAILVAEAQRLEAPGPRILYSNPALERKTRYTFGEVIAKTPRIFQGDLTSRAELDRVRPALAENASVSASLVNCRKDGSPFGVQIEIVLLHDENGAVIQFVAIQRDVTDENSYKAALKRENDRFETTAATSPSVILSLRHNPDGRWSYIYSSPGIHRLAGMSPQQIQNDATQFFARIDAEDIDRLNPVIAESACSMTPLHCEYRLHHPERGVVWIDTHSSTVMDDDGSITVHGTAADATERILSEMALRDSEELP